MIRRINFHSRVLLSFVGILMLALFGAATAIYLAAEHTGLVLAQQQLALAGRVAQNALAVRDRQLRDSTRVAATDFGFREAVTSGNKPTVESALEDQRMRLRADLAAVLDEGGGVRASTDAAFAAAAGPALLAAAVSGGDHRAAWSVLNLNGQLLQLVVVPVGAPGTSAWLCTGLYINRDVVDQIKATAGVDISFVAQDGDNASGVVSTLPAAARAALTPKAMARMAAGTGPQLFTTGGSEYLTAISGFTSALGGQFAVVLQIPKDVAAAPMTGLRHELLLSGGLITALCLVAAILSSRMLAKPVRALSDAARSLSRRGGDSNDAFGNDELTQVAKAFHSLLRRAHYDALTGLPNRTLLKKRLDESLARAKSKAATLAVVFIDLNGFKAINDTLGHEMGDLVLRKTAQRLSRSIGAPNTVARLGGDEFVIVLEGAGQSEALREVERLIPIVSTPMVATGKSITVGMSAGIAMYPEIAVEREELMRLADTAMYHSKLRKGEPVVAKPVVIVDRAGRVGKGGAPASPAPIEDVDTWNGAWLGKDLSTQFPVARPTRGAAAPVPGDEAQRLAARRNE